MEWPECLKVKDGNGGGATELALKWPCFKYESKMEVNPIK